MRPFGTASIALAFSAVFTAVLLSACPRQKEGERCDFRAGQDDNSDCGDGLVCIKGQLGTNSDVCCPDPASGIAPSHPACVEQPSNVGGGGAGGIGGQGGSGGTMATTPNGDKCTLNSNCFSGTCAEVELDRMDMPIPNSGLCCATPCPDLCMSCQVSGSVGTCAFIPAGEDPDGECPATCDGAGMCQAGTGGGGSGGTGGMGGSAGMGGN